MDHAKTHKLGLFQSGNQSEHTRLLAPFHLRLKSHEAEMVSGQIVLPQLDGGVRFTSGSRIN